MTRGARSAAARAACSASWARSSGVAAGIVALSGTTPAPSTRRPRDERPGRCRIREPRADLPTADRRRGLPPVPSPPDVRRPGLALPGPAAGQGPRRDRAGPPHMTTSTGARVMWGALPRPGGASADSRTMPYTSHPGGFVMPAHSIGPGTISFGLVAIPIRLYTAAVSAGVAFHLLHATCGHRIRQQLYCPVDHAVVERGELVKGYDVAKDHYVPV